MIQKGDDLEELFSTGGGERKMGKLEQTRFFTFLKHEVFGPFEPLPAAQCPGDKLIFHWVNNPSADLRSMILIMAEAIMLLCGLLLTVSADALFSNACVLGESSAEAGCSSLEIADLALWSIMLAMEAAALGSAAGTCNIISFLNDDDLREWVLRNWIR